MNASFLPIARYDDEYKRVQTLVQHSSNTAAKTAENLRPFGLESLGLLLGWLHDIGKGSEAWQTALDAERQLYFDSNGKATRKPLGLPHAPPASRIIYQLLSPLASTPPEHLSLQLVCMVIQAHHGYLMDAVTTDGEDRYLADICIKEPEHKESILASLDEFMPRAQLILLWQKTCEELVSALRQIKAACVHCGTKQLQSQQLLLGLLTRHCYTALIDADRLDAANFSLGRLLVQPEALAPDWTLLLKSLEHRIAAFPNNGYINRIRADISMQCKNAAAWPNKLFALHAPTGGGKTLASLRWALERANSLEGCKRIFYVVSYTTILDQVYAEYQDIFKNHRDKLKLLLHHSNIIQDEYLNAKAEGSDTQEELQLLLAERWDADIILTTQVQFFNALFLGTGKAARRMRALEHAVIIFDEVQTIPPRLTHLFNMAISYLTGFCGCDVLLSSATQPTFSERIYPLPPMRNVFKKPDELFRQMKRVKVIDERKLGRLTALELADFVLDKQRKWTSVLLVLNTRTAARKVYDSLVALELQNISLYILSNDMCCAHRRVIIDALKDSQNKPCICVSTQLIECGVDLSFGCAVRSLAGADSIWQTAGRCNRHGEFDTRPVYIIQSADESLDKLPDIQRAQNACILTLSDCSDADDLQLPGVIAGYYNYYFHNQQDSLSYPIHLSGSSQNSTLIDLLSCNNIGTSTLDQNRHTKPKGVLHQAFSTAGKAFNVIDSQARAVIVPYKAGAEMILDLNKANPLHIEKELLRQAQQYAVNVFDYRLKKLIHDEAVFLLPCGAYALKEEWYDSKKRGLLEEPHFESGNYIFT